MTTRALRSNVMRNDLSQENQGLGKMALKTRTTGGGLRTMLNAVNPNIVTKPVNKVAGDAGKPGRLVTKRSAATKRVVLSTRSSNVAQNVTNRGAELPGAKKRLIPSKAKTVVQPAVEEDKENQIGSVLPPLVEDIDTDDKNNPQLVYEYVNEIHGYLMTLESRLSVSSNYLDCSEATIKPKMRNLLVDWLVDVHQQFSLLQETLYLTVAMVDRYLQTQEGRTLQRQELQLLGVTALFVASKYEEMYPPEIGDFVYITDHAYTGDQIRSMEVSLLASLDFELGRPLPINFLRRYSKAGSVEAKTHGLAKYVMELSVVEYDMSHLAPSQIAAASLAVAMFLTADGKVDLSTLWTPTLIHYSTYSLQTLMPIVRQLASLLLFVHQQDTAVARNVVSSTKKLLNAVPKKYGTKKFMHVTELPVLNRSTSPLFHIALSVAQ